MAKILEWKDNGYAGTAFNVALPFLNSGHEHQVTNTETGEQRNIQVHSNQTLKEAINTQNQWVETCNGGDEECVKTGERV